MKKIFIFLISFISLNNYYAIQIPTNSIEKTTVCNWVVANVIDSNDYQIGRAKENPLDFFQNFSQKEIREINLSKFNDVTVSLYQIFKNITFNQVFIASCFIETNKKFEYGFDFLGSDMDTDIYLNGKLIKSEKDGDVFRENIFLEKGRNHIQIIGKPSGAYLSAFNLKIFDQKYGHIKLHIVDSRNNVVPANSVNVIKGNNEFYQFNTNRKGDAIVWVKPGEYQFYSKHNEEYLWTDKIKINEGLNPKIKLQTFNKSKINGTIFTLDNKTPNPGILIEAVNAENQEVFWKESSDINGKFTFYLPNGKWNFRINLGGSFKYHMVDGEISEINLRNNSVNPIILNLSSSNEVRGSWGKITMFDGMLSNSTHKELVSKEDLLYMGTYNGLSVFDGLKVKSYNYDQGLPNGYISELFEDEQGFIWIGYGVKGLVKWKDGKVINHFTTKDGLPSNRVNGLDQDKDGNIIIGTGNGLSIFNGEKFVNYNFTSGIGNGFITEVKVVGNNIWIGCGIQPNAGGPVTIGGGLTIFNGNIFKSFDLSTMTNLDPDISAINDIERDKSGNMWIGTFGGLLKYDGSSFELFTAKDGLPSNNVRDIFIDDYGVWVGTSNGLVNISDGIVKSIVPLKKEGLKFEWTGNISKSKDGIYFLATGDGVYLYDPISFRTLSAQEGMPIPGHWTRGILDVAIDNNGFTWAASGTGGLYKLKNDNIIKHYTSKNSGLAHNYINQIEFSSDGSMWLVQHKYISKYNNGIIVNMNDELKIPKNVAVRDIAFDEDGTIWLATTRGLGKFENNSFTLYSESDGLIRSDGNCDVNVGKNNEIIYSTYGYGFSVFNGETFTNYTESNGLADNRIWDFAIDSKNNYWLALDGAGVQKFDGENFENFQIKDGVTAGETFTIYVDDFDKVWVGTFGGGVCYYDGELWNSVDTRDGILDNLVQSICGVDGNKYWFGSANGITAYEPKHQTPNVYIEKIETANSSYKSIEELINNKGKILQETRITFTLNSNSFNTKKEKQKYLVSVINKGKIETKLIKTNEFEFFPEKIGKYQLEFQSIDRDNNYSKVKQIEIKAVGPWYKNLATAIPFWGFLVLLVSFSSYSTNRYFSQRRYTAKVKEESRIRLEEKNKEIVDSINYAKRIQDAMMTSEGYRKSVIPKSFTFFKPKDVVSGDFYWVYKDQQENIFFTVADCTGHGVPGAFMSMIGTSLLNEIIVEKGIKDTNKILDEMRAQIIKSLNQDDDDDQKDGMDISICKLNLKKNSLEFSGAHNPLLIVSGGEIKTFKGDSQAVGLETVNIKPFTKHSIKLQKNDMLYLYSDGYQDQFGGENGKKYMAANFKKLLLKLSKEDEKKQNKLLEIELANWMKNQEQIDDICIMGVRV
jgi:ligand-binding sensor domain-containing protein/serine phosphatase RsbU (regulator of sigma subunit)